MKSEKTVHSPSYFRQLVADKDVAALHASSRYLVGRLMRCLPSERIRTIVELGPGPGVATRPILALMPAGARYLAIEKNPDFLATLGSIADPRFTVIEGDARELKAILASRGVTTVDAVIASIPFSFLDEKERAALVDSVWSVLSEDGDFVIFHQFSRKMRPFLKKRFAHVKVQFEPRNIFPCFLLHGRKRAPARKAL